MSVSAASVRSAAPNPAVAPTAARGSTAPSASGESTSQRNTASFSPYLKQLDVSPLNALAKETLLEALTDIQGQKTLVLDKALSGPLGLVTDVALLKVSQFHRNRIYYQPTHRQIPLEPSCGQDVLARTRTAKRKHSSYRLAVSPKETVYADHRR